MNAEISVDVNTPADLPTATMLRLFESRKKLQKYQVVWERTVKDFPSLFIFLESSDVEPRFDTTDGNMNLLVVGDGERLTQLWRELRRHGFVPNVRPESGEKRSELSVRFSHLSKDYSTFWLYFTSTLCTRIQVGTRTIEVPVYEIQCESLPDLIESEQTSEIQL